MSVLTMCACVPYARVRSFVNVVYLLRCDKFDHWLDWKKSFLYAFVGAVIIADVVRRVLREWTAAAVCDTKLVVLCTIPLLTSAACTTAVAAPYSQDQ